MPARHTRELEWPGGGQELGQELGAGQELGQEQRQREVTSEGVVGVEGGGRDRHTVLPTGIRQAGVSQQLYISFCLKKVVNLIIFC